MLPAVVIIQGKDLSDVSTRQLKFLSLNTQVSCHVYMSSTACINIQSWPVCSGSRDDISHDDDDDAGSSSDSENAESEKSTEAPRDVNDLSCTGV